MSSLKGKKVLVTGSSKRLGRAISLQLAASGCDVVIHYRESEAEASELKREVEKAGRQAWTVRHSLDGREDCEALVKKSLDTAGSLDFLVNNASVFPKGEITSTLQEDFDNAFLTNSLSPLWLSNAFADKTSTGAVVNMLDTRISGYDFSNFPYYLSKKMLESITENLALRYAPRIRFNGVAPGLILPPEGKGDDFMRRAAELVPMRTHGSALGVAEAVAFLLENDFITGQIIYVDGGQHLLHHTFGAGKQHP